MERVYIYPNGSAKKDTFRNPYIRNMVEALSSEFQIANHILRNRVGILQVIPYYFRSKIFILNWTENLPSKKLGFFQTLFFVFFTFCLRLSRKKFIWVLHNKQPHIGHSFLAKVCMYCSVYNSDYIITHASEGITYIAENYSAKQAEKVTYIPHPTYETSLYKPSDENPEYDLIIWGAINRYKGVVEFLEHYHKNQSLKNLKILICGQSKDKELKKEISDLTHGRISFHEGFIDNNDLYEKIGKSRAILFLYKKRSVLSSGALIMSILYQKPIIGPSTGAFLDLKKDGIVYTYNDYPEIPGILDKMAYNQHSHQKFINENTWEQFAGRIKTILKEN